MSKSLQPDSKSGFVRANINLSPDQIIEKGESAGLSISKGLIYMVRAKMKGESKPRKVRVSAKKKNGHVKAKRKYTRRAVSKSPNGAKTPVNIAALVERFVKDLEAVQFDKFKDTLTEAFK